MVITYAPKDILQIDDARLYWTNFEGRGDRYNREGDRNFVLRIDSAKDAEKLQQLGWNVKIKPPREEDDEPFYYMTVKVKFNDYGPRVYLIAGNKKIELDESTAHRLDKIAILSADLDVRPYDWEVNGKTGRTAYLQSICVTQRVDRFADRFVDEKVDDTLPF